MAEWHPDWQLFFLHPEKIEELVDCSHCGALKGTACRVVRGSTKGKIIAPHIMRHRLAIKVSREEETDG